ncbi:amidohydrolase [Streptomyces boninensis]|uniref:amidohydrolase n=1 Tax=Streptomyces boninensis TaxID=2039455 RepID=UPI003B20FFEE
MTELVDHHSHGAAAPAGVEGELGIGTFETLLGAAAGARGRPPAGVTHFDGPLGRALRRWCPPLLGLDPHCSPALYLARRRELGGYTATRALLRGAGIGTYLVDGDPGAGLRPVGDRPAGGRVVHEIVRLESLARQVAKTSGSVASFLRNTAEAVYSAGQNGTAYAVDAAAPAECAREPGSVEVRHAASQLLQRGTLAPALVRHLLWAALATGLPVQLHGGDPYDLDAFIDRTEGLGTDLVLIPGPRSPQHAAAARRAAVHAHVYADAGPEPAEPLRLAPAGKLLFSTGARALPELYVVAAHGFAAALARVADEWPAAGLCSARDAERMCAAVGAGTARRVYGLRGGGAGSAG